MPKRILSGIVLNTQNKTARVVVTRVTKHPKYGKTIKKTTKYLVHDELNTSTTGEKVSFIECPPKSKRKAWELVSPNESK